MRNNIIAFLIVAMSVWAWFLGGNLSTNNSISAQSEIKNNQDNKKEVIETNITDLQNEIIKVWNSVSESVVSIIVKKDLELYRQSPFWMSWPSMGTISREISWWTGFFIDDSGTIITNKHVVNNNWDDYIVVTNSWEEYDAQILWFDQLTDLAVIKIFSEEKTKPVKFVESEDEIKIWQFWIAIGNALAKYKNSITLWIISWKNRSITVWDWDKLNWLIQTDAAINPWNSWGPLTSISWKVLGINTAISWDANWIWFSIPLSERRVKYIKESIEKHGEIKRAYLWVEIIEVNRYTKPNFNTSVDYWNYVRSVEKWSNAEKYWIEKWDIILEAEWEKLMNKNLTDIIQNRIPWDNLSLKIYRDSEIKEINIKIWEK